ncbi:hypothetical protein NC651_032189 [Populus alba x Populus x berolinensis]|nr:hypothetical protein NC651_032189 [Populus alba x Populus x berolinensis]
MIVSTILVALGFMTSVQKLFQGSEDADLTQSVPRERRGKLCRQMDCGGGREGSLAHLLKHPRFQILKGRTSRLILSRDWDSLTS